MMLHIEHPLALLLLALIPLYVAAKKSGVLGGFAFPLILADWNGTAFTWQDSSLRILRACASCLLGAAFVCAVCALANPVLRHQEKVFVSRGTDVFFVLDTSPSMAALDIAGTSRLEAARTAISALITRNPGAAYGLVAMAAEATVLVPPTTDTKFFFERMSGIAIGELGDGTALGTGISAAVYHLAHSAAPRKCIILITDGENNAGSIHPYTAARLAKDEGIIVYALGLGTSGNVPLEYVDPKTGKVVSGSFKSGFDSAPLVRLTAIADGQYFGVESAGALSDALSSVLRQESVSQRFYYKNNDRSCARALLLLCMALVAAAWCVKRLLLGEIL